MATKRVKFRDVPYGGRINYLNRVFVVLEPYGSGKICDETFVTGSRFQGLYCWVDVEAGITLDTEVDFIKERN